MSLEQFALDNLAKRHAQLRRNGVPAFLTELAARNRASTDLLRCEVEFVPDAIEPDFEEETLRIYAIDGLSTLTRDGIHVIEQFGHTLYNYSGWYSELWVVDRYGVEEKLIWAVKDEIMRGRLAWAQRKWLGATANIP